MAVGGVRTSRILIWCLVAPVCCFIFDPGFWRPGWLFNESFAMSSFQLPIIQTCLAYCIGLGGLLLSRFSNIKIHLVSAAILMYVSAMFWGMLSIVLLPVAVLAVVAYFGLGLLILIPIMASIEYFREASRLLKLSETRPTTRSFIVFPLCVCAEILVLKGPDLWISHVVTTAVEHYRVEKTFTPAVSYKVLRSVARIAPQILYSEAERQEANVLVRAEFLKVFQDLTGDLPPRDRP